MEPKCSVAKEIAHATAIVAIFLTLPIVGLFLIGVLSRAGSAAFSLGLTIGKYLFGG
jgi:hypothetical protein